MHASQCGNAILRVSLPHGGSAAGRPALDRLAGGDPAMLRILDQARRLVDKQVNILLQGETGTGKDVFAKALHAASGRADAPFVAVNCAAFPESLIESELFGYAAGAFTGARSKGMTGLIAQSHRGTLFLDEIGDMPLALQTRLLRVLAEKEVLPLGGDKPVALALTVIAASHRDLRQQIAAGTFREDLYYRLCGATLCVPPLRERSDRAFIIDRILAEEAADLGTPAAQLAPVARTLLMRYRWPGNIRQLRNVVRYALALSDGACIGVDELPSEVREPGAQAVFADPQADPLANPPAGAPAGMLETKTKTETEAARLLRGLRARRWNITAVAQELGVYRTTIYRQMKRLGIRSPRE